MQELDKKQMQKYLEKAFSLDPDKASERLNPMTLHVGKMFIRIDSSVDNIDAVSSFVDGLEQ